MKQFIVMVLALLTLASPLPANDQREDPFLARGNVFLATQDYGRAVREFEQATRINPVRAEAWLGMGTGLLRLSNTDVATNVEMLDRSIKALTTALRLNPALAEARRGLGEAYLALGNKEKALQEQETLRVTDSRLASELAALIAAYRKPPAYHEVGARNEGGGSTSNVIIERNLVLVPATLYYRQRTAPVLLALDTGASITVINASVAYRLGMPIDGAPAGKIQVVGGGLIRARAARLQDLRWTPLENRYEGSRHRSWRFGFTVRWPARHGLSA